MGRDNSYRRQTLPPQADFWRDSGGSLPDVTSDESETIRRSGRVTLASGNLSPSRLTVDGSVSVKLRSVTGSVVLNAADDVQVYVVNNGIANVTITLPNAAACRVVSGADSIARHITIKRGATSTGAITIAAAAGNTVQSTAATIATYGATTSLNTTNADSAVFVAETATQWGCVSTS